MSEQIRVLIVDDDALVRAGAGDLRFPGGQRGRRVAHVDLETVPGGAVEAQLDRG